MDSILFCIKKTANGKREGKVDQNSPSTVVITYRVNPLTSVQTLQPSEYKVLHNYRGG